jgi:hypothetical protein
MVGLRESGRSNGAHPGAHDPGRPLTSLHPVAMGPLGAKANGDDEVDGGGLVGGDAKVAGVEAQPVEVQDGRAGAPVAPLGWEGDGKECFGCVHLNSFRWVSGLKASKRMTPEFSPPLMVMHDWQRRA